MAFMSGNFTALGQRDFRRFWSGSTLATTGFMMSFMLVPSVAFKITGSNAAAGLAQMGSGIAMFAVSPIGGVIADRVRKKPIVFFGQAIPALVILVNGILIITDVITISMLSIATLIMGLGFAFMGPARQAWVGELVSKETFPNAIALQQIAQNVSQVAAPLLVALLVGNVLTIGQTYVFMASLFAVVLPITARLPNTKPAAKEKRSVRSEMVAGFSYVWREPRLRTLWLGFVGIVVCGFAFQTLLPGLLTEELGHDPTDIGPIFLVMAVAGLAATLPLAGVVRSPRAWPILMAAGVVMATGFLLLSRSPSYGIALFAAIPIGVGRSAFMLVDNSLLMANAQPAFHGRVMSLAMMGFGSQALLAPLWGLLADHMGVRTALFVAGLASASVTALIALSWLRQRSVAPAEAPARVSVAS